MESQVTGNLWKWLVKPGEKVEIGQKLAVIESMKMEIMVESAVNGLVHTILKAEGELVKNGEFLLLLDRENGMDS